MRSNAQVFVRLNGETSREQADRRLRAVAERLQTTYPEWDDGIGARLQPAREGIVQSSGQRLWVLFGSVTLVLLIACSNIAGLFLARGVEAEEEMAIRVALGASRSRLVRLVLSEAVVVGSAAGLLGLCVCHLGVHGIQRWAPPDTPRLAEVTVDFPVLAFILGLSVGASLFLGLLPSLRASRVDIQSMMKAASRTLGLGSRHRIQRVLVVGQISVAAVLLIGSGLLLRSFMNLQSVDPGVDVDGRAALHVSLPQSSYPDRARVTDFLNALQAGVGRIPGVEAVGSSVGLPFQGLMWRKLMTLEDHPAASLPEVPVVDLSIVTPGWLETLGIPLVRGRALLERDTDGAPRVALVNEAFVRTHLPDQDPLGRRLRLAAPDYLLPAGEEDEAPWFTIVGVVGDVRRWSLAAEATPEVYIQQGQDMDVAREFFVVAHTDLPAETLLEPMRKAVRAVDPSQPVAWVRTMGSMYSSMMAQPRFSAALVSAFGVTALFLSLIGVYGLMAHAVAARRREIGLRLALGADPGSVLRQFVGRGALDCLLGIALGLLVSAALGRIMRSQLFGVEALDPVTYSLVVLLVLSVAVVAAAVPSRRAVMMDPTVALRSE